jgi:hypothetical protein
VQQRSVARRGEHKARVPERQALFNEFNGNRRTTTSPGFVLSATARGLGSNLDVGRRLSASCSIPSNDLQACSSFGARCACGSPLSPAVMPVRTRAAGAPGSARKPEAPRDSQCPSCSRRWERSDEGMYRMQVRMLEMNHAAIMGEEEDGGRRPPSPRRASLTSAKEAQAVLQGAAGRHLRSPPPSHKKKN